LAKQPAYLSQHIGDLKNHETFEFYTETITRFQQLFRIKPKRVAVDMHPDYFQPGMAVSWASKLRLYSTTMLMLLPAWQRTDWMSR
jgi:hydrogenase maturation protein HypF